MIDPHVYAGAAVVAPKKVSKMIEATRDSRDIIKVIAVLRASDWQLYNAGKLDVRPIPQKRTFSGDPCMSAIGQECHIERKPVIFAVRPRADIRLHHEIRRSEAPPMLIRGVYGANVSFVLDRRTGA